MRIELKERYEEHVRIYFEKTRDAQIRQMLPQKCRTVEEALEDYRKSLKPGAASFGRTIYADGKYIEVPDQNSRRLHVCGESVFDSCNGEEWLSVERALCGGWCRILLFAMGTRRKSRKTVRVQLRNVKR